MLVLGLDTSSKGLDIILMDDLYPVANHESVMERGQDRALLPAIQEVLNKANRTYSDITRVAVSKGPGSFTGLRIGLAAAIGISKTKRIPLLAIDRFSLYQEQFADEKNPYLIILDGKRPDYFCQHFRGTHTPTNMMSRDAIRQYHETNPHHLLIGDLAITGLPIKPPREKEVLTLAKLASSLTNLAPVSSAEPYYLREPDITTPSAGYIIRPLTAEDSQLIHPVHESSFYDHAWPLSSFEASLRAAAMVGFVALKGQQAIGFILGQRIQDEIEILTFAVLPESRRLHIGKDLLSWFIEFSELSQVRKIILEVSETNSIAQRLYREFGFHQYAKRSNYYRTMAGSEDALLFCRERTST